MTTGIFTSQVPSSTDNYDGNPINVGTTFSSSITQTIRRIRWYAPLTHIGVVTGNIYHHAGGVLLAGPVSFSSITPGAWNVSDDFGVPPTVTAAEAWTVAVTNSGGGYVSTAGIFTGASVVNGTLTGIQAGTSPFGATVNNATYKYGVTAFPDANGGGASYFADIDIDPAGGAFDPKLASTFLTFF